MRPYFSGSWRSEYLVGAEEIEALSRAAGLKVLLLSQADIEHQPRLRKAAKFWYEQGASIAIFCPRVGMASAADIQSFTESKNYQLIERDMTKESMRSKVLWLVASVTQQLQRLMFRIHLWNLPTGYIIKSIIGVRPARLPAVDIVIVHLAELIPFALKVVAANDAKLVFDSQEYFTGQYAHHDPSTRRWIEEAYVAGLKQSCLTTATTNVMARKIAERFMVSPPLRLRNFPYTSSDATPTHRENDNATRLIWQGMTLCLAGRGVKTILEAVAKTGPEFCLVLQGNLSPTDRIELESKIQELQLEDRVELRAAATPELMIQSLQESDIGLLAETADDQNYQLTDANKLAAYIHAGLMVVAPALEGYMETAEDTGCTVFYEPDSSESLYETLTALDTIDIQRSKEAAVAARATLIWPNDYQAVFSKVMQDCVGRSPEN